MAGAAAAHQAAAASREGNGQQRVGRTRRTTADPQRAQQGATAAAAAAPAALDSLSRLQQLADASPQVAQLRRLQALADGAAGLPFQRDDVEAEPPNRTGLPDALKAGIESLSGLSMDVVRVQYNSAEPAKLNALAYAQGSDIQLASGQERHLPHEAWHVVQQAQGRVKSTMQMKHGLPVNDDPELEREADVMGAKAAQASVSNVLRGPPVIDQAKFFPSLLGVGQRNPVVASVFHDLITHDKHPIQKFACSGSYLAGLFNQNNVTALRVRIGEPAFQYFMTLETTDFSPMIDAFLPQAPIANAHAQVAYLQPYTGNPAQMALGVKALQRANYSAAAATPFYAFLQRYEAMGVAQLAAAENILTAENNNIGIADFIYKYTQLGPRVLALARTKLGLAGNNPVAAEAVMAALQPYDYFDSVKTGAEHMAAAVANDEITHERQGAAQDKLAFEQNYQTRVRMPITTAFNAGTAKENAAGFLQVFPHQDLGTGNWGAKREIMNTTRNIKIAELDGRDAVILGDLPNRTGLRNTGIRQTLAPLYALPGAEAAANWCIAQAGQDLAKLTQCAEIMVACNGDLALKTKLDPLNNTGKRRLLARLSNSLQGQLSGAAINDLVDLLAPLNGTAIDALVALLHPSLNSRGIDDLILELTPANGTQIDAFVRAKVPALNGSQLADLIKRLRPLSLGEIDTYVTRLLTGLTLPDIRNLTIAMTPGVGPIGDRLLHLISNLMVTIANPMTATQVRTLVTALDGLAGDGIDTMVTQLVGLNVNTGPLITTRITNMRGSVQTGGAHSTDVTKLDGERILSGAQIAGRVDQVSGAAGNEAQLSHYPHSHINPAGRAENLLWEDCNRLVNRHASETAADVVVRQQMALNAINLLPGVDRQIAQRVFAEQDGRRPRAMKTGAQEDAISGGHIDDRHVLGTGGTINTLQNLQDRANGTYGPPCPGIAGAYANAGASQAGMQSALNTHILANPNNWHLLRTALIRGLTRNFWNAPAAVAGHVARQGQAMNNAPTTLHLQMTGINVDGGFHVFESWPTL